MRPLLLVSHAVNLEAAVQSSWCRFSACVATNCKLIARLSPLWGFQESPVSEVPFEMIDKKVNEFLELLSGLGIEIPANSQTEKDALAITQVLEYWRNPATRPANFTDGTSSGIPSASWI